MALTKLPKNAIADDAIDASKIEDGTIQAVEVSGTIPAEKLSSTQDYSSKTVTLPNTSVTSDQLAGSIANAKLSNSTFTVRGTSRSLGDSFSIGVDVDWQSVITASGGSSTASAGLGYMIDTTSGTHTLNLPASASIGDTIVIKDYAGTFATNNLTIGRNGHNIQGVANDSLISTNRASLTLVYVDATKGWLYTDEHNVADLQAATFITATGGTVTTSGNYKIHTFTGDGCFVVSSTANPVGGPNNVDYLVVAGGGGGSLIQPGYGGGGGGGAGGYRESHSTPVSGCYTASPLATPTGITVTATTYPITVGAGGGAGSNSVFSTITSAGGGQNNGWWGPGINGGSGGGGTLNGTGGSGNSPPTSPPQGNPGGNGGGPPAANNRSGGGGGAGGSGSPGPASANGGSAVGTGINPSPCVGTPGPSPSLRYFAGGGGGANSTGSAGSGGGGGSTPGNGSGATSAATANTGSGSGGGVNPAATCTSTGGGKGIVIIRYKYQ